MILLLILLHIERLLITLVKLKCMLQTVFHCCYMIHGSLTNIDYCHCRCLCSISLYFNLYHVLQRMRLSVAGESDIAVLEQLPIQFK